MATHKRVKVSARSGHFLRVGGDFHATTLQLAESRSEVVASQREVIQTSSRE